MDNSAVLTWEYPDVPGLEQFRIYKDETPEPPEATQGHVAATLGNVRTFTFTGLPPGTYYFSVRALVSGRLSGLSNQVSKTVEIPVPVLSVA